MKKRRSHSNKSKVARGNKSKKDRTRNDKGIILEQIVAMLHDVEGVKVETNAKIPPKSGDTSRKPREIDVLLTSEVAGYSIKIAIQCKNYGKKIDIGKVGEFKELLDDVGIPYQHGIIVSVNGYQAGVVKRAKELGMKTFILEGLDKTRLEAEILDTFQFFVHLLLVIEKIQVISDIPDSYLAFCFSDENKKFCGFFTDLIVNKWRNGEIPMRLGEYEIELKLPQGWHQVLNDRFVYPHSMSAIVKVVGYLAEMSGKAKEFKLREAETNKIEKFNVKADFDVLNNLIKVSREEPIFTEEELQKLKKNVKVSVENRIRLPKIFLRNHLEPLSKNAFNFLKKETENLTFEEIAKLPEPKFEEIEGDVFEPMLERSAIGEPVFIDDKNGNLVDVRLLTIQRKSDDIIELLPQFQKFPRKDFAEYLTLAFLAKGDTLLEESLSKELSTKKIFQEQAFNLLDKAIQISPNLIDTYLSLGVIFGLSELYEKSIQCFNWVVSAQPENAMARYNLAETYLRMGKLDDALNTTDKAIEEIREVPVQLLLLRIRLFKSVEKYREAIADLMIVWRTNFLEIVENEGIHDLILDIYKNYQVIGTAVVLSDIYLYYARKFANKNSPDESKNYFETTINLLEDIYQVIKDGNHKDFFETSFNPVLFRAESLINEIDSIYSATKWKIRLKALKIQSSKNK